MAQWAETEGSKSVPKKWHVILFNSLFSTKFSYGALEQGDNEKSDERVGLLKSRQPKM